MLQIWLSLSGKVCSVHHSSNFGYQSKLCRRKSLEKQRRLCYYAKMQLTAYATGAEQNVRTGRQKYIIAFRESIKYVTLEGEGVREGVTVTREEGSKSM